MTILVTGATGHVGRRVAERLIEAGERVRVLTRNPEGADLPDGAEICGGDLSSPATLEGPLDGVRRVYLFPVPETAEEVAGVLEKAGVEHVALLSSMSITEDGENNPSAQHHLTVEKALRERQFTWTFVRPTGFATNTLWRWGDAVRAEGVVRAPYGRSARALIHESDIGDVAAEALLGDECAGKVLDLTGPELLTQIEQVRLIGEAIGREIRFEEVTPEQAREAMAGSVAPEFADMVLGALARQVDDPGPVLPTVEEVTGRPARTFAQWARDHADDFLGRDTR
ncbi:NAD(P)H-binding protein [Streptomyces albidus (ex Kaewkla and Franco 2022)]|uniref:NAD(P)H-binding protein n=1 Tax=Streptomyces albidus (ex Kaewkla and Franco 2022) TaxID=722709 RepID=UPI0015EEFA83|nr:NAD(P)H-binding protein [Streptomyces albidus (ex Kaewkla and Franco 2022)]